MFSLQYGYWPYHLKIYKTDSKKISKCKYFLFFMNGEKR